MKFVPYTEYPEEEYLEMFEMYYSELRNYMSYERPYSREETIENYLRNPALKCFYIEDDETQIGLIILQTVERFIGEKPGTYPPAEYISEFYILPEFRREGKGREAVKLLTGRCKKDIFLYILKRNVPAKRFWSQSFEDCGWKQITRPEIHGELGCEINVYARK